MNYLVKLGTQLSMHGFIKLFFNITSLRKPGLTNNLLCKILLEMDYFSLLGLKHKLQQTLQEVISINCSINGNFKNINQQIA